MRSAIAVEKNQTSSVKNNRNFADFLSFHCAKREIAAAGFFTKPGEMSFDLACFSVWKKEEQNELALR